MRVVKDLKTPVGKVLRIAAKHGALLEAGKQKRYAVLPLDDDLIDFLLERSPKLIKECRKIDKEMKAGKYTTHDEVKRMFRAETRGRAAGNNF